MKRVLQAMVAVVLAGCATATDVAEKGATVPSASAEPLALVAQAQARLEVGEISEGLKLFALAVAAAPGDTDLREEYGLALAGVGLNDGAIEQLTKAGTLTPSGEATLGILLSQAATSAAALETAVGHLEVGVSAIPEGPQARMTLAQTLLRLGRGDDAWKFAQLMLSERPDDPRVNLLAGQSLRMAGRLDEAADYLKRAATNADLRPRATLELVETLAAGGKYREAADLMGELIRTEGTTVAALTRWAALLLRAGDRDKATGILDDILAKDPTFYDALLLRAMLAAASGDVQGGEQLYRRALAIRQDDPDAALGLARLLVEVRRMPEARELLDGVWSHIEQANLESEEAGVEVAQERAALELIDERPDDASPWLKRIEVAPLTRRSLALWAGYFWLRNADKDGVEYFRSARVADDPGADRARAAFEAEFALAAGDDEGAQRLLAPLLQGTEDEVLAALGTFERGKRYTEVVELSRQAMERLGKTRALRFALAASLERSGSWEAAESEFRALLAEHPDDASSLNYLGYMYADRGVHLDEAREMLEKAVSLEPTSGAFIDSLGWVYFKLGNHELAEKHLTEAARLVPSDPTVNEHIGDLYSVLGDRVKAEAAYRKALESEADDEEQPERLRRKLAALAGDGTP